MGAIGWPSKPTDLPSNVREHWTIKDYLSLDNGIVMKGNQIFVPATLQKDVLNQLHNQAHQGVEKT
jgi:hypothetical protein